MPPHGRRKAGICFVPEERLGHAAVPDMSLTENVILSARVRKGLSRNSFLNLPRAARYAGDVVARFSVKTAGIDHAARSLSGGNLQKFVVGREIMQEPSVLVASQPTWGVDAGAAAFIQEALIQLARDGAAVLVISQDLDELFAISDRIAVIANGRLSQADPVDDLTLEQIGLRMGGQPRGRSDSPGAASPPMLRLEPRREPSRAMQVLTPVFAVILTILAGLVLFAILGKDPFRAIWLIFFQPLTQTYALAELTVKGTPLILIGTGLAMGFRAGVWNIGAEGQFVIGALAGGSVALALHETAGLWVMPLMCIAGMLGGMAWAAVPAFLRTRFNANEILTSLMLSSRDPVAQRDVGRCANREGLNFPESRLFSESMTLRSWSKARRPSRILLPGGDRHIAGVPATHLRASRSRYRARRVAARSPVIREADRLALPVAFGGPRLAGTFRSRRTRSGSSFRFCRSVRLPAIIVAFLGRLHPFGILLGGLLMALTYIGGEAAQIAMSLPSATTRVFQGMLLFFLLAMDVLVGSRIRWIPRQAAG